MARAARRDGLIVCLLAFSWCQHPHYRLILVANRDEFHARPTAVAGWWDDHDGLLGGRDLEAGGSWLALHRRGRLALATNYREAMQQTSYPASRGALVSSFVAGETRPRDYADALESQIDRYAGFNLLICDGEQLIYLCNRGDYRQQLSPGIYALSNGRLDTPWPKVLLTRDRFTEAATSETLDVAKLFSVVADSTPIDDNLLPDTGIDRESEKLLSAPFVISPTYGTRCSSVVLWARDGNVEFFERSFDSSGRPTEHRRFEYSTAQEQ